jgi:hypothetical protein
MTQADTILIHLICVVPVVIRANMNSMHALRIQMRFNMHYASQFCSLSTHPRSTYMLRHKDNFGSLDSLFYFLLRHRGKLLRWEQIGSSSSCNGIQAYNQSSI